MGRLAISRAVSMDRRVENTRSWKRCSRTSSNNNVRIKSLERGVRLWRLNHELLPEPGSPIASTTTPFGGRGDAAGTAGTFAGAAATGSASWLSEPIGD